MQADLSKRSTYQADWRSSPCWAAWRQTAITSRRPVPTVVLAI